MSSRTWLLTTSHLSPGWEQELAPCFFSRLPRLHRACPLAARDKRIAGRGYHSPANRGRPHRWRGCALTTADALSRFAEDLSAAGRSPRTVTAYLQAIARALAAMNLAVDGWISVTPIDLAEWRRQRAAVTKPATVNLKIDALWSGGAVGPSHGRCRRCRRPRRDGFGPGCRRIGGPRTPWCRRIP